MTAVVPTPVVFQGTQPVAVQGVVPVNGAVSVSGPVSIAGVVQVAMVTVPSFKVLVTGYNSASGYAMSVIDHTSAAAAELTISRVSSVIVAGQYFTAISLY